MMIQPLHNYVLIDLLKPNETSGAGLVIPDYAKEKPREGVVLEVGEYVSHLEPWGNQGAVSESLVGKHVLIKKWGGVEIQEGEKTLLLIAEVDILAILK